MLPGNQFCDEVNWKLSEYKKDCFLNNVFLKEYLYLNRRIKQCIYFPFCVHWSISWYWLLESNIILWLRSDDFPNHVIPYICVKWYFSLKESLCPTPLLLVLKWTDDFIVFNVLYALLSLLFFKADLAQFHHWIPLQSGPLYFCYDCIKFLTPPCFHHDKMKQFYVCFPCPSSESC